MAELHDRQKWGNWPELLGRCVVSFILVLITQCTQFLVPHLFYDLPVFVQLLLSALMLLAVAGAGGWCRRLLRVRASAPAFVFFSVLFIWLVYLAIVRHAASHVLDLLFNGQIILLSFGLFRTDAMVVGTPGRRHRQRMLSSDPGLVSYSSSPSGEIVQSEIQTYQQETEFLTSSPYLGRSTETERDTGLGDRVRCCHICKAYVKGFDHHCPAFGNCIGHKNYLLFMVLLTGFLWTESTYLMCLSQYGAQPEVPVDDGIKLEISLSRKVASSTRLFSILQLVWQVGFFLWHMYCICFNIRTDEWIHWKRYPEFQFFVQSEQGQKSNEVRFKNPYDKGILQNVKEFMESKR